MNAKLKTFLLGLFSGILTVVGAILVLVLRRPPRSVQEISTAADEAVKKTAEAIKHDSDEELASRFNRLAKKEKK